MTPDEDVIISVGITLEELKSQLAEAKAMLKNTFSSFTAKQVVELNAQVKKMSSEFAGLAKGGLGLPEGFDKKFTDVNSELSKLEPQLTSLLGTTKKTDFGKVISTSMERMNQSIRKSSVAFQGWALSLMFAGMIATNAFKQIWQFGSKAFQDVSHSIEGTTTGFDILSGAVTYLGFSLGQAFEPIAAWLAPIIVSIADWVSEHEELSRTLLLIIGGVGLLLTLIGQLTLFTVNGIIPAFTKLGTLFSSVGSGVTALSGILGVSLLATIGIVVAAVLLLYAMWKTNFGGMRDYLTQTFGAAWEVLKALWESIKGWFSGLMNFLKGLFSGDFDKMFKGLLQMASATLKIMIDMFIYLGVVIANAFIFAFNLAKDILFKMAELIVGGINHLLSWLNGIASSLGIDLNLNVNQGLEWLKNLDKTLTIDYISSEQVKDTIGVVNNYLTIETNPSQSADEIATLAAEKISNGIKDTA